MKLINYLIVSLIFAAFMSPSVRSAEPDPILSKVEKELRKMLAGIVSELSFEYSKDKKSLYVKYKSRKFMVYGRTQSGRIYDKAYEREGPSYEGLYLRVDIQKAGHRNQAKVPQTLREPYWMTDIDVTLLQGTEVQLFWVMSYGSRTKQKLRKRVKTFLNGIGKKEKVNKKGDQGLVP
jgi:hypothetical protein